MTFTPSHSLDSERFEARSEMQGHENHQLFEWRQASGDQLFVVMIRSVLGVNCTDNS
ncbi:hypothetical protein PS723_05856 [Pseudomonas fluorescens]|uniref:Uncharacterized protein n=1 Tax=Pseudomonas fluorescens TaxID=294 RepID=A0A5E7FQQ2_PSEFL|nr:hypothetical protein PS723_05856 [Pseudomonas fluorescens]